LPAALAAALLMSSSAPAQLEPKGPDFSAVEAELTAQCASGRFSGIVVVRARGREVLNKICGEADLVNDIPITRDTRFKIYSTSKLLTGLAVMRLVEQGKMELDRPISLYVPDAPPQWNVVTIRQLLNHSSGIADLTEQMIPHFRTDHPAAMRALLRALTPEQAALATKPGETFRYNNFGFELLADGAARAAGKPFAAVLQELVFDPAGMKNASVEEPNVVAGHLVAVNEQGLAIGYNGEPGRLEQANNWAFVQLGAGAVRANVDDFIALDAALKAGKIISPASWKAMQANPIFPPAGDRTPADRGFGLGLFVHEASGVRMLGHTGGNNGYISDFEIFPDDDGMMIVLTNRGFTKTAPLREGVARALKAAR
jgi:CubicO group peptidase (beta-lactamase class C family)